MQAKPNKNKPIAKKLSVANAALRRVNGKGPKVKLTVIIGKLTVRPRLKFETFNTVEAAQKCVTRNVFEGREVHLFKEIEFELTAELKGRIE